MDSTEWYVYYWCEKNLPLLKGNEIYKVLSVWLNFYVYVTLVWLLLSQFKLLYHWKIQTQTCEGKA